MLSSETKILVAFLTDMKKFPYEQLLELYHNRWPGEEDYKILKSRFEVENFSGKSASVHSVYQGFHAKVYSKNLPSKIADTSDCEKNYI